MFERAEGIYEIRLHNNDLGVSEIKIFVIPGNPGKRSLMIDTGFGNEECYRRLKKGMEELGISCEQLDIFITHRHHDHSGLAGVFAKEGARIWMNPKEDHHAYDCIIQKRGPESIQEQELVLQRVGITRRLEPGLWSKYKEVNQRVQQGRDWYFLAPDFPYVPVHQGDQFCYGSYVFEAVELKGHTFGQTGLLDREHKILFCADQVIDGIIPIVPTSYPDEGLLKGYFQSLQWIKENLEDYLLLPAHKEPITQVRRVIDRIVFSYVDKVELMKRLISCSRRKMTTKEVAYLAYGIQDDMEDDPDFISHKMMITKTFSCLEYLYGEDFVVREEKDGTFYWGTP